MTLVLSAKQEELVQAEITTGQYASAEQVVEDALQTLVRRNRQLSQVRSHIQEGIAQAERGEFSSKSVLDIIAEEKAKRA
jgi:antitoxin ParD1/3/4